MIITAEMVKQELNLIGTGRGGPAVSFGEDWRELLPDYVLEAWFNPPSIQYASNRYGKYITALKQWYDQLKAEEETVTAIRGFYSIDAVVDSLAQCNDELENALSCVHHYKNDKKIMEQIDRLSRNYVALAVRITK